MMLIGAITWFRGGLIIVAQILGAIASAGVVQALFPGPLGVKTTLNDDTSVVRGLFIEMFLTAELVFTIFMLAAEKHKANFIAPIGIGLCLFICEMSGKSSRFFTLSTSLTLPRCLLHWRISQPCSIIRPCCCRW